MWAYSDSRTRWKCEMEQTIDDPLNLPYLLPFLSMLTATAAVPAAESRAGSEKSSNSTFITFSDSPQN